MRIFAVGASGILGRQLVPMLLARGHRVTAMSPGDRVRRLPALVTAVRASLLDPDAPALLDGILPGHDAVLNLASAVPSDPAAPGAWDENTRLRRQGTGVLVDAVRRAAIPRLAQMSITMAYGDGGEEWLDESTPLDPDPGRGVLVAPVAAMEATVRRLPPDEVAWTVLRGGRFVGPGTVQDAQRAALRAGTLPVPGDGSTFVSMVHVRDYAAAVVAAVEVGLAGEIFNVCAEPVRLGDYLDRLAELSGAPRPARAPWATPDLPSQRVRSDAVRQRLGWRPEHGLWPAAPGRDGNRRQDADPGRDGDPDSAGAPARATG
jgi:nucleoside-diphosphate-sugar epimerase